MLWRSAPSLALASVLAAVFAVPAHAQSVGFSPSQTIRVGDRVGASPFRASMVVRFDRATAAATHARPIVVRVRVRDQAGGGQNGTFSPAGIPKPRCTVLKGILVGSAAGAAIGWVGGLISEPHNIDRAHNILADMAVGAAAGGVVGWLLCGR